MDLETADFSLLMAAGYKFPEPFTVKAADGVTDLYGVMYKPYDFDSTKVYPIVEYVYPGPQTESVAKSFSTAPYEQALAQFGFIVVTVGNRGGNPDRSKWYHNYGYGNLRDYGLADKKVTVEELAEPLSLHRPWTGWASTATPAAASCPRRPCSSIRTSSRWPCRRRATTPTTSTTAGGRRRTTA